VPSFIIPIIVCVILFMLVAGYFSHQAKKKRREELAALAASLGWRFSEAKNRDHDDQYRHGVFRRGSSRYAYNTLTGSLETPLGTQTARLGDYHYTTESSDSDGGTTTHTHRFSYLLVKLPVAGVPSLTIREEGMFDKIGSFLGFDDIDFESAEFSKKFHVKCKDKRFAYDLIDPRMMEFLLAEPGPLIELQQGYLCVTKDDKVWRPSQFQSRLAWARRFFERWPTHLIADLESRSV